MEEIKELFLQAVERNEIDKFLKGEGIYKVSLPHMVPVSIPTDWTTAIPDGVYEVFKEKPELNINRQFEKAILSLIDKDIFNLYVSVYVIFEQLQNECRGEAPFKIDKGKVVPLLIKEIKAKQEDLKNDFRWTGANNREGLWGDFKRIDEILKEDTGEGLF